MIEGLKAVHLFALVMWLGPTTGGYLLVRAAIRSRRAGRPLPREQELWLWARFETLLRVEHGSFLLLVVSGLGLLHAYGMSVASVAAEGPTWLRAKLGIVFLVLVPLEAYDVILSHVRLPREIRRLQAGEGSMAAALLAHERFLARGVWLFAVLIPLLFGLAVFRP